MSLVYAVRNEWGRALFQEQARADDYVGQHGGIRETYAKIKSAGWCVHAENDQPIYTALTREMCEAFISRVEQPQAWKVVEHFVIEP